jgi:hypothetical protein
MQIDFTNIGEVRVDMSDYVRNVLHYAPPDMKGTAVTPACSYLFQVNPDGVKLSQEKKNQFVHMVMQLLYLSQRGRPDIRTAIAFLCGRLRHPDQDDYNKLGRVIKYLRGCTDLPLVLKADGTGVIKWWIDASYAVHSEMQGHTGGTMSLGKGCIYSTSAKQKLVSRSSTESEVIGMHDVLPQVLWTNHFLQAQGFDIHKTVVFQDNMSSILMEKNGRNSSSKRTRHMNIRYFFVKDKIANRELEVDYCPTEKMIADFFTKPLQGKLFNLMRDEIMGVDLKSKYHSNQRSVLSIGSTEDSVSSHERDVTCSGMSGDGVETEDIRTGATGMK